MVAFLRVGVGVHEGGHSAQAIFLVSDKPDGGAESGGNDDQQMPPFDAADDEHRQGATANEGGGSEILDHHQKANGDDGDEGEQESGESIQIDGAGGEPPCQKEHDGPFRQFRRLHLADAERKPATSAVLFNSDMGNKYDEAHE